MKTVFNSRFLKDLDKLTEPATKAAIADVIEAVEKADALSDMAGVKKLRGFKTAYRIRAGDFRIGVFLTKGEVEFVRVLHRKDIYKLFP